ncbi:ice-binding family protein [Mucilaginibacter lappiensis]|uniref:ice-binding family protein n=1 Tax=Mucilaginibacter lappiensis TaxID=354630 RepID=UPI003D225232
MSKKSDLIKNSTQVCKTQTYSKLFNHIWPLLLLVVVFTASCNKDNSNPAPDQSLTASQTANSSLNTGSSAISPAPINLRTAGNFTILTETGISTTGVTSIIGNIGSSPIASTAITGFGLIKDASNQFSRTPIVTGNVYAANYAAPTPSKMTTAVNDMKTAFTTANGIVFPAPKVQMYAGDISGRTLRPGLYKWSTGVLITKVGVTLSGGPNDVWVFQIAQNLTVNNSAIITLAGGAQAKNVFWVVSGKATLGTTVNFKGIILSKTLISLNTGAKVTGKLLAQTAVTLIANSVHP